MDAAGGLERWVHDKLSSDNDSFFAAINRGLEFHRAREAAAAAPAPSPAG